VVSYALLLKHISKALCELGACENKKPLSAVIIVSGDVEFDCTCQIGFQLLQFSGDPRIAVISTKGRNFLKVVGSLPSVEMTNWLFAAEQILQRGTSRLTCT
jgi:hypothetical protein